MFDYTDHTVIVTGAGQGIGYGLCKAFAAAGATVILNDIDAAMARDAAGRINAELSAERVHAIPGDAGDVTTITALVDQVTQQHGPPRIAIANAGITQYMGFLECTPEAFDNVTGLNLRGSYFLAQAAAKQMIAHGIGGRILLQSSVVGMRAFPNFSVYGMTKAGLQMLAKTLALELGPHGITVNAISPGAILTERTVRQDPHYAENWATVNATGRVGMVEDIVNAALFLASPQAEHITGQNLVVDGGWTMQGPIPAAHPDRPVDE